MAENHKRQYRRPGEWKILYQVAEDEGTPITHQWYVDNGYCSSQEAARKLSSRHVKAGWIAPTETRWPQSFRISHNSNNVTLSDVSRLEAYANPPIEDQYINKEITLSVKGHQICQSLQIKEHSLCDVSTKKPVAQTGAERNRTYRKRLKSQQHCTCSRDSVCEFCYNTDPRLMPISAYDALHGSKIHPKLREDPDKRFFATRDSLHEYPLQNHRTYFAINTPPVEYLDPTLPAFSSLPGKNHSYRGKFSAAGISCHYEIYEGGYTTIKPRYTHAPKLTSELHAFMQTVYAAFPHWAPTPDKWQITAADIHRDAPTTEPGKRHVDFYYKGVKFQGYNKTLPGGKRVFRLEAQISPDCTIVEYPIVVKLVDSLLMEVLGKN